MVNAIDVREQHARYEDATPDIKEVIREAFGAVVDIFECAGLRTGMSDQAEELVAAIHHYYERSKP